MEKLDLLVVCDPYPTTWACSLSARMAPTCCRPAPVFEMNGSRTASNRSLQWGEQIVPPVFECRDYVTSARTPAPVLDHVSEHWSEASWCRPMVTVVCARTRGTICSPHCTSVRGGA